MNILFLSTRSPYPLISGHSLRTYHILRGAAEKHNVYLLSFVQLEDELKEKNISHLRSFCKEVVPFRIPGDFSRSRFYKDLLLGLFSRWPYVAKKYDSMDMRREIRRIINTKSIDLVHVDLLHLSVYLNEFKSLPKILVNHNVESLRLRRWYETERNPLKKFYLGIQTKKLESFERVSMNQFNACVVVSDIDRTILQQMGIKAKMFVVPNGTDTEFFRSRGASEEVMSVLWIGHMDVHTNRDAVMFFWKEIYPMLKRNCPHVKMTFVGTSPPVDIAHAAENDPNVAVTGFVDDIRDYLEKASVMVVPIRIGSGTRLKILDAMGMGKAIVSTSVGCEGLDVTDGKDILIADDPEDFATKTKLLLEDGELRSKLQKNARTLAESYDWRHSREKQERVYQYVMGKEYLNK